jgi:dCTP deaminase
MLLSDRTINALLFSGDVKIVPRPEEQQFQPISVDLRLGNSWARETADGGMDTPSRYIESHTVIRPGEFMLACTMERITLIHHIAGLVHGKSTWARRGLMVEAAGLVDPGFDGTITLELKNMSHSPIYLSAGMAICQITFHATDVAVGRPYGSAGLGSHYQGQTRAEPARG